MNRERYTAYAMVECSINSPMVGRMPSMFRYVPYHAYTPEQATKLAADASVNGEPCGLVYEFYSLKTHEWEIGERLDKNLYYVDA